jgi:hypothetical protein
MAGAQGWNHLRALQKLVLQAYMDALRVVSFNIVRMGGCINFWVPKSLVD